MNNQLSYYKGKVQGGLTIRHGSYFLLELVVHNPYGPRDISYQGNPYIRLVKGEENV